MSVVTLLTDFGWRDPYVAEMKAALVSAVNGLTIIDISHDVDPGNVPMAAYILGRTWSRFPSGTVHVVVVDPGVGTSRRAIAGQQGGHSFVGPDNGIFSALLRGAQIVELSVSEHASPTFHGRDVFAPAASRLLRGTPLSELGRLVSDLITPIISEPRHEDDRVIGQVVYVDRFGNLITNLSSDAVRGVTALTVGGALAGGLRRTFGDVSSGQLVVYVGSGGAIEVAVRDGSAARTLNVGVGTEVIGVRGR